MSCNIAPYNTNTEDTTPPPTQLTIGVTTCHVMSYDLMPWHDMERRAMAMSAVLLNAVHYCAVLFHANTC